MSEHIKPGESEISRKLAVDPELHMRCEEVVRQIRAAIATTEEGYDFTTEDMMKMWEIPVR